MATDVGDSVVVGPVVVGAAVVGAAVVGAAVVGAALVATGPVVVGATVLVTAWTFAVVVTLPEAELLPPPPQPAASTPAEINAAGQYTNFLVFTALLTLGHEQKFLVDLGYPGHVPPKPRPGPQLLSAKSSKSANTLARGYSGARLTKPILGVACDSATAPGRTTPATDPNPRKS